MNAVTNNGMKLKVASRTFRIPSNSPRDHFYGKVTCKQRGTKPTLNADEEKKFSIVYFQDTRSRSSTYFYGATSKGSTSNIGYVNAMKYFGSP